MRKLVLLASMLAMVLVAASPALASPTVTAGDDNSVNCFQAQVAFVDSTQVAVGGDLSGQSAQNVSNEVQVKQSATQNCIGAGFFLFGY